MLVEPGGPCELDDSLQPARPVVRQLEAAEPRARLERDLRVADALRELERPLPPPRGFLESRSRRADVRKVRIRARELATRRYRLEQHDRLARCLLGFAYAAGAPEDPGEPAQRVGLLAPLTEASVVLDDGLDRLDRSVVLVGQVTRLGAPLEQRCPFGRREGVAVAERPRVLRRRLAVGAE